jgi:uncharacterized protein
VTPLPAALTTEEAVLDWLLRDPAMLTRHAGWLEQMRLPSLHDGRVVSLHERQLEQVRERLKTAEERYRTLIQLGHDNQRLAGAMHRWTCAVMQARHAALLGPVLVEKLRHEFAVPQVALRMWRVAPSFAHLPLARPVSERIQTFAASLAQPFCGYNAHYEAAQWLDDPAVPVRSLAMIPLRPGAQRTGACFGLLVLGSPDPARYHPELAVDFLAQIGEVASAALSRLLVAEASGPT